MPSQVFIIPENVLANKMSLDNIAMVWAPNLLRCSSAPSYLNAAKEMAYLRVLLQSLETTECERSGDEDEVGEEDFEGSIAGSFF